MENWKNIIGFENYQISDNGRIKNINGSIKKLVENKEQEKAATLCKESKYKTFVVKRLVAIHFVPNTENKKQVWRKIKEGRSNHYNNLEWR